MSESVRIICESDAAIGWNDSGITQLEAIHYDESVSINETLDKHVHNFCNAMIVCGCSKEQLAIVLHATADLLMGEK